MPCEQELKVEELSASIDNHEIVREVSLTVCSGETLLIFGPNGAGKTTLLAAIAGLPRVKILRGRVRLGEEDVTSLPVHERVRRGILLSYQIPPELTGVTVASLAGLISKRSGTQNLIPELAKMLEVEYLLDRDAFKGFSGGERKRVEVFLTMLARPKFALLDEPDSGVDIDSVKLIGNALKYMVDAFNTGLLVVTHTRLLVELIGKQAKGVIFKNGSIACSGGALELFGLLEEKGFEGACNG